MAGVCLFNVECFLTCISDIWFADDNASENTPSWLFPVIIVVVLLCCCFLFGVLFCVWRQKKRATTYDRPNPYEESYTDERSAYSRPSDSMDRRASVRLANNHQGGGT